MGEVEGNHGKWGGGWGKMEGNGGGGEWGEMKGNGGEWGWGFGKYRA